MPARPPWRRWPSGCARLDGDNPARRLLQAAQQEHSLRFARRRVALDGRRRELEAERTALEEERNRLEGGEDAGPPVPHTRDAGVRAAREGAPLWQLVDFRRSVSDGERAGLEAALEAAGLLDAWVSPDGRLQADADGKPVLDTQALERGQCRPRSPAGSKPQCRPDARCRRRSSRPCSPGSPAPRTTPATARPGSRPTAASASARWPAPGPSRRRSTSAMRPAPRPGRAGWPRSPSGSRSLPTSWQPCNRRPAGWSATIGRPTRNGAWRPPTRRCATPISRRPPARATPRSPASGWPRPMPAYHEAEHALKGARQQLAADAADLACRPRPTRCPPSKTALDGYHDAQSRLCQAASDLRLALPELQRQRERAQEGLDDLRARHERCASATHRGGGGRRAPEVLRETVGAKVEELMHQLADARAAVDAGERELKEANEELRDRGEARAVAGEKADTASALFEQRSTERARCGRQVPAVRRHRPAAGGAAGARLAGHGGRLDHRPRADAGAPHRAGARPSSRTTTRPGRACRRQIAGDFTELQRALERARPPGAGRDQRLGPRRAHRSTRTGPSVRTVWRCASPRRSPSAASC